MTGIVVFQGCPAYLRTVLEEYVCEAWLSEVPAEAFEPGKVVTLHLDRTPGNSGAGDVIEVDDYIGNPNEPGYTTFGPSFPGAGRTEGAVYLEQSIYNRYKDLGLITPIPTGEMDYQSQVRAHIGTNARGERVVVRYYGFAATVDKIAGRLVTFRVTDTHGKTAVITIDLDQPVCDPTALPRLEISARVPLFLPKRVYASAGPGLNDMKIPHNLGAAPSLPDPASGNDPSPMHPVTGSWVIATPRATDVVLQEVQAVLTGSWTVGGWHAFVRLLHLLAHQPHGGVKYDLDLVAHSSPHHQVLVFGDWHVGLYEETTESLLADVASIRSALRRRINQIRLIGCATAGTPKAERALSWLREGLGIPVVGTPGVVGVDDFHDGRYNGPTVTTMDNFGALEMPNSPRVEGGMGLSSLPRRRRRAGRLEVHGETAQTIAEWADLTSVYSVPGILAQPLLEIDIVVGDRAIPVEVLLGWRWLRFYPGASGDGTIARLRRGVETLLRPLAIAAGIRLDDDPSDG